MLPLLMYFMLFWRGNGLEWFYREKLVTVKIFNNLLFWFVLPDGQKWYFVNVWWQFDEYYYFNRLYKNFEESRTGYFESILLKLYIEKKLQLL